VLLDASATSVVAVVGVGVGAVGLLAGAAAHVRLGRVRRAYAALVGGADAGDLVAAVEHHIDDVSRLRGEVAEAAATLRGLRSDLTAALRHVAVVRYDAFQDMGGRMSFSVALLDDAGDGLIVTSINGRTETRTYAKGITGGRSEADLSPEEQQAVSFALGGARAAR
jgi:hypothetical protein